MAPPIRLRRALLSLALLAALAVPGLAGGAAAQGGARPNVVLLVADDLGYGDLGAYGSPDALTPHLDGLAARGLRLTDFYAGGPVCTPSRYALLTGTHAFRAGDARLLDALLPRHTRSGIDDGATTTLAEALSAEGYETALVGKWHLGHGRAFDGARHNPYHPLRHGFDAFFGVLGGAIDYNTHWNKDDFLDWWEGPRWRSEDSLRYATHVFGDRIVDYVDARAGAGTTRPPFFLYLPVTAPHVGQVTNPTPLKRTQLPLGREREYLSRFDHLYPEDTNVRKRYLAMTAVLDDEVGRLVDALERNGLMGNTVVWFLSDHGADTTYGSNGLFRGEKGTPYEGGVRVPSFVVWEGRVAPGASGQVAGVIDVLPTLLALADAGPLAAADGLDLSAFLLGGPPVERGLAVPNTVLGDAYRLRRWKYVRRYEGGSPLPAELYDLAADLAEETDLAAVYPDTLALLASLMPYGPPRASQGVDPAVSVAASPNPLSDAATVRFSLAEAADVRLAVYDALGREVAVLVDGRAEAGAHRVTFDARGHAAGVYVYRLVVGEEVRTGRLAVVR